jgi:pimeloyl-ACP methyl ester carboxylesterase
MKRVVIAAAAGLGLAGAVVSVPGAAAAAPAAPPAPAGGIAWTPCPDDDPIMGGYLKGLECGSLQVPLDHDRPGGRKIALALTRARHTAPDAQYQGIALLNRGQWPVAIGRDLSARFAGGSTGLPAAVGATYDWIGFDPRGVGASEPKVACDPDFLYPGHARPDYVPRTAADERAWLAKARSFAESCGEKYGDVLKHLNTKATARDLDLIRAALGQDELSYVGYGYGTYLGSVYASMFPNRVRRMVLDSVVRPSRVGYRGALDQNTALEKRADIFFSWVAEHDSVYHLGATAAEVEANYYKGMDMLRGAPVDGTIGPAEYGDIFQINAFRTYTWTFHAQVLADWVLRKDPTGLRNSWGPVDYPGQNTYAMTTAIQCRDAAWPRGSKRWLKDHRRQYDRGTRFVTWRNAWYNAPCAFWPVPAAKPQKVGHRDVNILVAQGENDAVTPAAGAYEVHKLFPNSRLVLERGGNFHGTALSPNGNPCMNGYVIAYLKDGTRPASRKGVDASCEANPAPEPAAAG